MHLQFNVKQENDSEPFSISMVNDSRNRVVFVETALSVREKTPACVHQLLTPLPLGWRCFLSKSNLRLIARITSSVQASFIL